MKWFWWIGGAIAYLVIKNEVGIDSTGMWILVVVILLVASLLGQNAEAAAKRRQQEERDRQASDAAQDALRDFRQQRGQSNADESSK